MRHGIAAAFYPIAERKMKGDRQNSNGHVFQVKVAGLFLYSAQPSGHRLQTNGISCL